MSNNQKSIMKEVPAPVVNPRPHDKKKINPTVVVNTNACPRLASGSLSGGQYIDPTACPRPASGSLSSAQKLDPTASPRPASGSLSSAQKFDPTASPRPALGSLSSGQKVDPTVVVDTSDQPKPALRTLLSGQRIDPHVPVDSKAQSKPIIRPVIHDQRVNPMVVDTEAQPLAHNLHANLTHPYIRITPPRKKITTPLINTSKHRFKFKTCICWTIGLIFIILLILGATVGIIFLIFRPKIPNYSVDSLSISDLRLNLDLSLYAKFDVKIAATNPNKKIGIYYRKGSKLSVWYSNTKLCQGSLPKFYQGHQNTTKIDVALTGQNQYGSTLMEALQEQQQTGRIPLDLKVDVPVNIKLGKLKLRKIRILGTCVLTVDSLSANSFITIKASTCKFGAKL